MFDKRKALDYIVNNASNKKISQAALIENIYDYSHFNRMCNGKEDVNVEVLFACADKLGIPYHDLFLFSANEEINTYTYYLDEFTKFTKIQDYDEIHQLYLSISKLTITDKQFLQLKARIQACCEWECFNEPEKATKTLLQALQLTIKNFNIDDFTVEQLSETEINIINDISISMYSFNKEESIQILKQLVIKLEKENRRFELLAKCLFNVSLFLMLLKRKEVVEEALQFVNRGIDVCYKESNYLFLFPLYYNAAILHFINEDGCFEHALFQCYTFAKYLNRGKQFLDALSMDIEEFNISYDIYAYYQNLESN